MVDLKDEILNSEFKDRVLTILEYKEKQKDIIDGLKALLSYSENHLLLLNEEQIEKHGKELQDKKNIVVILSDIDLNDEEKIKLKVNFYERFVNIIRDNKLPIWLHVLLFSDIKNISLDSKFNLIELLSVGNALYDKGLADILRLTNIHKRLVLDYFENYVVAYVLAGSQVKGKSLESSDVDVFVVIDDTDVRRHTFEELKQKLYAIILQQAAQAKILSKSEKILHPQVYTLTEFWKSLSESNPVIITFLRDGIALYDRGMFIAWKLMLLKGIIKPSKESANQFFNFADLSIKNSIEKMNKTITDIIIEDLAVGMLSAAQAVIMDYGLLPPDPKETPEVLRNLFVSKNMLEDDYVKDLEYVWRLRKEYEHGIRKEFKYEEYLDVIKRAEKFIDRMRELKRIIDKENEIKEIESLINQYINIKNKLSLLFETSFDNLLNTKLSNIKDIILSIESRIKDYKNMQDLHYLKNEIINARNMLENIYIETINNLITKTMFALYDNRNKKEYLLSITKDKIYLVDGNNVYIYDYNGNKIGEMIKKDYIEQIYKELLSENISGINNKVINVLNRLFEDYTILKTSGSKAL